MAVKGEPIGALVAEDKVQPGAFGQRGKNWLTTVARQTAVAIENARLYDQLNRKIADLSAVNEIGRELTSDIRLEEQGILELIHQQASQLMDTSNMYIALYDEDTDTVSFDLMLVDGEPEEVEPRRGGQGRTEWIIRNREPILIKTEAASRAWYEEQERAEYIGEPFASWVGVPMKVGQKVLGVIAAYHKTEEYSYDKDHLQILYSMARQAAIALENARLYDNLEDRVQERTEQLAALQDLGVKITSQLDLDEVLGSIAESANELLSADFSTLFVYDPENREFKTGIRKGKVETPPSIPSNTGATGRIATSQEAEFVEDTENRSDIDSIVLEGQQMRAFAGVPLVTKRESVGVLYVNFFEPHQFPTQERELIVLLANQAAVAIENARLYDHLGDRAQQLEKAQAKIAETEAILTRTTIAADFVHRINNQVGTIPIWLDQIRDTLEDQNVVSPKLHNCLENIYNDVDDILRAAEQLNKDPHREYIDLGKMLQSLVSQIRIQTRSSIRVELQKEKGSFGIYAIISELTHAFWNIMENGIESMPEGGTLKIIIRRLEIDGQDWGEIEIIDDGKGIRPEEQDYVFSPFKGTKPEHMGYGLWRAKNVIERLGGTITFTSEVGEGTSFFVRLPLKQIQEVQDEPV
jgi:GAF domain-containing protein